MNGFKKIISAAAAAVTLLAGTAFPVSADYDVCDVNRDGFIGGADIVLLSRYLLGAYSISNYNQLDVNRSLTVDDADVECLNSRLLGITYSGGYFSRKTGNVVSSPTVSGFTPSESSSSLTARTYMRCRYENGKPTALSDYTLTPTEMPLNARAILDGVIGDDDRYASYGPENNGIVCLETRIGAKAGKSTGFIVGDHQIATAAHCVYSDNAWRSIYIRTYDSNGCITDNTLHPIETHIPKLFTLSSDGMYDYALITVSDDLSDYVHFSLGTPYNLSASAYSNIPVYVTGCPSETITDGRNLSKRLYSAEGRVVDTVFDKSDVVCYDVDVSGGDSGSPVYTITKVGNKYVYTAIAVCTGGVLLPNGPNFGSMITHYQLQFYKNNPNASYSTN